MTTRSTITLSECDLRDACHRTAWMHGLVAHGH